MPDATVVPGDIVSGLDPNELVEIKRLTPFAGGKTLVVGQGVNSRREIKRPLSTEQIAELRKVRGATASLKRLPPMRWDQPIPSRSASKGVT